MSALPSLMYQNAISRPSEDHRGSQAGARPKVVNWRESEPSAFATQTSQLPDRFELKTMRRPSGE
jgi:hypothetical protein